MTSGMFKRTVASCLVLLLIASSFVLPLPTAADDGSRSPGADIVVLKVYKVTPTLPRVGDNVTLNATLDNVGDLNATDITVTVTATNDTHGPIDLGTYLLGYENGGENITNDGSNNPFVLFFNWNTSIPGLEPLEDLFYTVTVTAQNVTDDNTTNGTASCDPFSFQPAFKKEPYISNLTVAPSTVIVGENVTVNSTLANSGGVEAYDEPIFFYVDYDWGDPGANVDIYNTTANVTELFDMGETYLEFQWNTTGQAIGNHTITGIIPSTDSNLTTGNLTIDPVPPPPGMPDLTIVHLGVSGSSVQKGEDLDLAVHVKNVGNEPSVETLVNVTDLLSTYTTEGYLGPLDPDEENVVDITIPTYDLDVGIHNLQVWVDRPNVNDEWNETNNSRSLIITVDSKPDLMVSAPSFYRGAPVTPISEATRGEDVTILVTVQNQGLNSSLNQTKVSFFLDDETTHLGDKVLLPYSPGASFDVTFVWNTSSVSPGDHDILVVIDPDDLNDELNETNNNASASFKVLEVVKPPDLAIRKISLSKSEIALGDRLTIDVQVANLGDGPAEDVGLLITLENAAGAELLTINETVLPFIAASSDVLPSLTWNFSQSVAIGDYFIRVALDPLGLIDEVDEENNENTTGIRIIEKVIPKTDLTISSVTLKPKKVMEGDRVIISVAVINMGDKEARGFKVQLFLDDRLEEVKDVPILGANGANVTLDFEVKFKEAGKRDIRISVLEDGVIAYTYSDQVKVGEEEGSALSSDMVLLILIVLLIVAIIITLAASKKKAPRGEPDEEEGEEEYTHSGWSEEKGEGEGDEE